MKIHTSLWILLCLWLYACQPSGEPAPPDPSASTPPPYHTRQHTDDSSFPKGTIVETKGNQMEISLPEGFYFAGTYEDGTDITPASSQTISCTCVAGSTIDCYPYVIGKSFGCKISGHCNQCRLHSYHQKQIKDLYIAVGDIRLAELYAKAQKNWARTFAKADLIQPVTNWYELDQLPAVTQEDLAQPANIAALKQLSQHLYGDVLPTQDHEARREVPVKLNGKLLILYVSAKKITEQHVFRPLQQQRTHHLLECGGACHGICKIERTMIQGMEIAYCTGGCPPNSCIIKILT